MRVRIIYRRNEEDAEQSLFGDVFVPRHSPLAPVIASAAAHGLVLAALPFLVQALTPYDPPPPPKAYHLEMLHLRVPDRVFLPAARSDSEAAQKAEDPAPSRPAAPPSESASAAPGASRPQPPAAARQMELPATRQSSEHAPVILQPDTALPQAPSVPPAPNMAFWNKTLQPPPPRKQAVIPGRVQETPKPPTMDAPPSLTPSAPHELSSDVAAMLRPSETAPKLPVASGATNPIRMQGKGGNEIASFEVQQSDPVNLIYLMADRPAPKQIEIPKGLQNAPRSHTGAGSDGTGAANSATLSAERPNTPAANQAGAGGNRPNAGPGNATNSNPSQSTATTAAAPAHPATGNAAAPSAHDSAADAAANAARAKSAPGNTPAVTTASNSAATAAHDTAPESARAAETAPAAAAPDPGVIRVNHPANGNFDVVILQSATRDDLPNVGTSLSGNPVYTVYLNVGDKREWLLEYCVPQSGKQAAGVYQVNIDDSGVVAAPYPVATAIPEKILELQRSRHIALHGVLSATGVFRNVTAPDMDDPLVREVLPLLSQWRFRPALRDKVPVEVEVLLIIPARS